MFQILKARMDDPTEIEIRLSLEFQQSLRKLAKKYRNIRDDIEPVIEALQNEECVGDHL